MRSIQSEIDCRKLLFFARLILKEHGNLVSELFKCRVKSYFVDTSCSIGFIKEVVQLLRTTVPFVTTHLEIFHCTHHPVIPKSDLYFTFCSTLNALSKRTSK